MSAYETSLWKTQDQKELICCCCWRAMPIHSGLGWFTKKWAFTSIKVQLFPDLSTWPFTRGAHAGACPCLCSERSHCPSPSVRWEPFAGNTRLRFSYTVLQPSFYLNTTKGLFSCCLLMWLHYIYQHPMIIILYKVLPCGVEDLSKTPSNLLLCKALQFL